MQVAPTFFPALDAVLNGSSAVLIGGGLYCIKKKRIQAHKRLMLAAFTTSVLFLISYLYYHVVLRAGVTHFRGQGISRPLYFTLLTSHTILAVVVVPFVIITLVARSEGPLRSPSSDCALHVCYLDVRVGDRCGDLPDAVQDLRVAATSVRLSASSRARVMRIVLPCRNH